MGPSTRPTHYFRCKINGYVSSQKHGGAAKSGGEGGERKRKNEEGKWGVRKREEEGKEVIKKSE